MQLHNVEQGTSEWFTLRLKYPLTASEAQAIGNQGKGLETLCWEKLAEKYSSGEKERFGNEHTERGQELESQARDLYELETGRKVEKVGFVTNEAISSLGGASPDSLVDDDGLIEIKCFADTKHFKCIAGGETFTIESAYLWQMNMQMLFTGRKWCDFVAYNPNYSKSLLIQRVYADSVMQEKIIMGLKAGERIISEIEAKLK